MAGNRNATDQLKQFWASRNGRQKAFLLGGAGATAVLLALFVRLIGTPDYKPLFTGLEPADAQALSAKLDAQGIPHQISADGKTMSVPADKLDAARMQTATDGEPHSGRMGFELFDKMSWGQTEFDEKVTYQRALEGELERSIETLADVESARVHLVMPTDSVFLDRQRGAKASVVLKLRRGTLSKDAALAISRLVSGAVDELKPEDVSIVDADSDRSLGIGEDETAGRQGGETDLSSRLISTLEPIVGAGKIRASVNVDYDQDSTDESQEKYDPTVSAVLSSQKSQDLSGGSAAPSGVPGTSSNVPTAKDSKPAAPVATQTSTTESTQYGVNKTMVHTITPAGRIERITAAILVDDAVVRSVQKGKVTFTRQKRTPEELNQIKALAEEVIGFDEKRGDAISVANLSFDADGADLEVSAPTWTAQVQKTVADYSSLLRPVSLLALFVLAYLFVLRPVQKHALSPATAPSGAESQLPAANTAALPGGAAQIAGAIRAAQLKQETAELIKQKPQHTARALQAWMREEPS
ncbi:MAG: flagellar basal-body MS-ring/collar protein FliF [Terracidiphilus sp.]